MRSARLVLSILLLGLILIPISALANCPDCGITIKDTSGVARAFNDEHKEASVEFNGVDESGAPANGKPVTLTLDGDPSVYHSAVFANGTAVFEQIPAGTYVVASDGVHFTNVSFGASQAFVGAAVAGAGLASGGVGAAGAVAAAGTAGVITYQATKDDDDPNREPEFPEPPELSPSS